MEFTEPTDVRNAAHHGRARSTSKAELSHVGLELFIERGFDHTTVDDIAAAAGIGRRTFFRYFPSKNDLPWGDFDVMLDGMRRHFAALPDEASLVDALRQAVMEFNRLPDAEVPYHRQRMELLLRVPTLLAHSTLRYESWRQVVAEYVARRLDLPPESLQPQTIARVCLGIALSAYDLWLQDEHADLLALIDAGFLTMEGLFVPPASDR
ncbi:MULTISPECIES: mycofactocin system transcriptional regulator [unclassified Salinibacterium]|uniref:mycofactocin system transcriptional regulator n=1 Tax=unclassified Salinibacterium TaxID=2632331 RepID=UPI0014220678|nr:MULTISPECIES: mycofactocin system transcriptional regulator [unclassified Salinibacterium]